MAAEPSLARLRRTILALLFLSTVINYVDRQALSVLAPELSSRFGWSSTDYSHIVMAFQVSYAVMQTGSGYLIDRLGTRVGFVITMVWWSLAGMAHSLARSGFAFGVCRFLLGIGEAGNWPGSAKATAEWFPPKDRAMATGIWNMGSSTGAIIAPPLIAWLATRFGWQSAFLATGALGFAWVALWWLVYYRPADHPRASRAEVQAFEASLPQQDDAVSTSSRRSLLARREVFGLTLARFISDPVWWFYVFWLPKYLADARGFTLMTIGLTAWVPFLTADLGCITGGAASSLLIRRGWPVVRARKAVMLFSASLMLAAPFAARVSDHTVMLILISIATFAHQSWASSMLTLPADLFSGKTVASVTGITGSGAGVGGILATFAIGLIVQHVGYAPIFTWAGLMHPISAIVVLATVRQSRSSAERGAS
jgi:ACS family hexuronate transporter-like MFS transporter